MKETLIITGVKGFVGNNLKSYLMDSFDVLGVSRKADTVTSIYEYSNVEELMNKSKAFIHLAGIAHDLRKTTNDKDYFEANTELTKSLFDKFLRSDSRIFIYMSSVKAVADSVHTQLHENTIPDPVTVYGKSKLAAENYILSKKIPPNKKVYILRPCMIHGPGNKGNLNLLYNFVSRGFPYPLASFENKRSFLSVENLCFIVKELIERSDIASGIYNVADDETLSTNQVICLLSEALNKKNRLLFIPKKIIVFISKIGDIIHLPLNTEVVNKLTENYVVNNQKIKLALKKPLPLSVYAGILKTARTFGNN